MYIQQTNYDMEINLKSIQNEPCVDKMTFEHEIQH